MGQVQQAVPMPIPSTHPPNPCCPTTAAGIPGAMVPGMWASTAGMLPGPPPGHPPPPPLPGGRGDGRGRGRRDSRPDIIQMSYEEYFEAFKRVKGRAPEHRAITARLEDSAQAAGGMGGGLCWACGHETQICDWGMLVPAPTHTHRAATTPGCQKPDGTGLPTPQHTFLGRALQMRATRRVPATKCR